MKAGWYSRTGAAAEVIEVGEIETPSPGVGEILVRVYASGINPSDYKRRANTKVAAEFPRVVPHSDGAGTVAALGEGTTGFREGDRVWVYNAQWQRAFGTSAEYVSLPARFVRHLPANTSFIEGACFGIPAMTAYHAVHVGGPVGKTVYVPGATGRVGAYAVQFAKRAGARVLASTGSGEEASRLIAELGADVVFDRSSPNLEAAILAETQGEGVDRIIEVDLPRSIGFDERIIKERGSIVSFGAASAPTLTVTQIGRRARNLNVHFIFVYLLDESTFATTCAGIEEAALTSDLKHRIAGTFPLEDLAQAHAFAETSSGTGHVVVAM